MRYATLCSLLFLAIPRVALAGGDTLVCESRDGAVFVDAQSLTTLSRDREARAVRVRQVQTVRAHVVPNALPEMSGFIDTYLPEAEDGKSLLEAVERKIDEELAAATSYPQELALVQAIGKPTILRKRAEFASRATDCRDVANLEYRQRFRVTRYLRNKTIGPAQTTKSDSEVELLCHASTFSARGDCSGL